MKKGRELGPSPAIASVSTSSCRHHQINSCIDAAMDFGGVVCQTPSTIETPHNSAELSEAMLRAAAAKQRVVARGTAHSQGGQCLGERARVVSTSHLRTIEAVDTDTATITVGAGIHWREVADRAMAVGLIPPVLTDNLQVTVGGTLAVGGIGPASFRCGLQVHHCAAVEAVLGNGQIRWFSRKHEPQHFTAILGGLGRLGIISRARLALRPCLRYLHTTQASYDSLGTLLHDARWLLRSPVPTHLSAIALPFATPSAQGQWRFVLSIGIESDETTVLPRRPLVNSLACRTKVTTREHVDRYTQRIDRVFESDRYKRNRAVAYPWVECFLPWDCAQTYLERIHAWFPDTRVLLWPLTQKVAWPSLAMPAAADLLFVGILARVERDQLPGALVQLQAASKLSMTLGGKRYLSGWLGFNEDDWKTHYGPYWAERQRHQNQLDPARTLCELPMQ